ncbi:glucosaminidase domain-containing protein [uncultured Vagococcus sp.]|uniref:glucosaminidase domain-containing protein n=1 Tax=uncultured Vagococcus sp. TaxID=189676 RepID=UPI0028D82DF8|nr:glucosaminidase domain-containing protein [uncultured Vagococcus sp.]
MKQKAIRTFLFVALLSLLQPVAVSATEIAQLTQGNQGETAPVEEVVETTEGSSVLPEPETSASESSEPPESSEEVPTTSSTEESESSTEPSTSQPETKPSETRPSETKPSETKPSETKPSETKPSESKPTTPAKPVVPRPQEPAQPTSPANPVYEEPQSGEGLVEIGSEATVTFNNTTEEFIKKIGPLAAKIGDEHGLYASVMIAQAILESASGNSTLAGMPNYNLFGIKGSYKGKSVGMATQEDTGSGSLYTINANFRRYPTYKESLEDYAKLLKEGISGNQEFYKGTWKESAKTYQEATAFLTGKYATDIHYDAKLNGLIKTYELNKYDQFDKEMEKRLAAMTMGPKEEKLVAEATQFLGLPYVWGGTTINGFDCSGLVQYVYQKAANVNLPRVTWQQETVGTEVGLDELKTGDLLFFGTRGATHHVAMYLGDGLFIHAPEPGDVIKITSIADFKPDFAKRILN